MLNLEKKFNENNLRKAKDILNYFKNWDLDEKSKKSLNKKFFIFEQLFSKLKIHFKLNH